SENARDFSSAVKGEILADTARVIDMFRPDAIVLRHYKTGSAKLAAEFSDTPIINAGDGKGQHPTQALLDLYTIKKELGKIDGLAIAMSGDLKRGRTVRSLVYLLSKFRGVSIFLVSPPYLRIGKDIKEHLSQRQIKDRGITFEEFIDIREVAPFVDAIYQTRDQTERASPLERVQRLYYGATKAFFCRIDKEVLGLMKSHARILHPLPRNTEISADLDQDKRSAYFRQAGYGVPVRMAILEAVCG
ncbi:MAG: aspartate carbamoyltransferase 3, chloroplastic-like protein isoform X1, partial [Candidatus Giovannonibacteria bacterium GW2011_GWC2_44_8]